MKHRPLVVLAYFSLLLSVSSFYPAPAHAGGWLEFFFPSLRNQVDEPSRTLVAPFAEQAVAAKEPLPTATSIPAMPENNVPLDQPHRNTQQISEWLTMAVSESLTFEGTDYLKTMETAGRHFDASGKTQFQAFLDENKITDVLKSGRFSVHGFVQQTPLLLNEGVVDGRFRWLYDVPVMITYLDRGVKGYKDAKPVNQKMSITIQVGRTTDLSEGKDVAIERWTGKVQDIVKN